MSVQKSFVLGQVVKRGIGKQDTVKVRCLKMVLDKYLLKYFNKRTHNWAVETTMKVDIGDIVLLKKLVEKTTPRVGYEISEVVYKIGAVVDPITSRRCRGTEFIDETQRALEKLKIESEFTSKTDSSKSVT